MDYRNADGSLAEMWHCPGGRAARVTASSSAAPRPGDAGVKHLELHADDRGGVDRVTVDMGAPVLEDERMLDDGEPVNAISFMGNRTVVFVDDVDKAPVTTCPTETHPCSFRPGPTSSSPRWSTGPPSASGPGSGGRRDPGLRHRRLRGRGGRPGPGLAGRPLVELRGGRLELDWSPGGTVRMTGPAREVAHGTLTEDFFASACSRAGRPAPLGAATFRLPGTA